jgi:hypothetical protein
MNDKDRGGEPVKWNGMVYIATISSHLADCEMDGRKLIERDGNGMDECWSWDLGDEAKPELM